MDDDGRLFWCEVCETSTLQVPELIGERAYWCCSDCLTILGPVEHHDDGVQSEA